MMIIDDNLVVFQTDRLTIRRAMVEDTEIFYALWTDPVVMRNVGFPNGLPITQQEIEDRLQKQGRGCTAVYSSSFCRQRANASASAT